MRLTEEQIERLPLRPSKSLNTEAGTWINPRTPEDRPFRWRSQQAQIDIVQPAQEVVRMGRGDAASGSRRRYETVRSKAKDGQ